MRYSTTYQNRSRAGLLANNTPPRLNIKAGASRFPVLMVDAVIRRVIRNECNV
jgi:hypothetical protein